MFLHCSIVVMWEDFFDLVSCTLQTCVSYVCTSVESHKCIMLLVTIVAVMFYNFIVVPGVHERSRVQKAMTLVGYGHVGAIPTQRVYRLSDSVTQRKKTIGMGLLVGPVLPGFCNFGTAIHASPTFYKCFKIDTCLCTFSCTVAQ